MQHMGKAFEQSPNVHHNSLQIKLQLVLSRATSRAAVQKPRFIKKTMFVWGKLQSVNAYLKPFARFGNPAPYENVIVSLEGQRQTDDFSYLQ